MKEVVTESRYLKITNGLGLEATFSSVGAGLKSLTYKGTPLVLEPKDSQVYLNSPHFYGKSLARVAGRIPATFNIDDLECHVLPDPEEDNICLHGGAMDSLSFKKFDVFIANKPEGNYVIFTTRSIDGENGFPGNVDIKITYFMPIDRNEITIKQKAISDVDTPINISFHPYFNLGGEKDVNNYTLKVNASKVGTFKKNTLLINGIKKVPEYLDFRRASKLGPKLDKIKEEQPTIANLDHLFVFDEIQMDTPQVVLSNGKLKLEVFTDYDATNIYVDATNSDEEFVNGEGLGYRRAISIEPQKAVYPLDNIILRAGMEYKKYVTYRISDVK